MYIPELMEYIDYLVYKSEKKEGVSPPSEHWQPVDVSACSFLIFLLLHRCPVIHLVISQHCFCSFVSDDVSHVRTTVVTHKAMLFHEVCNGRHFLYI